MTAFPTTIEIDRLLVSTKFAPPRIGSRYIVRNHLLKRLWRDRQAKLAIVSASPGFGKTVLLAQWRQELMKAGNEVCWLALGADERDLPGFATHLFAALARLQILAADDLPFIGDIAGTAQFDGIVAPVVNALTQRKDDLYLLIDDYHHVEDPWAHLLLQKLIDHNPGNLHITLASRAVPPLSIAKLRVMGQVAEVECVDLPFDLAETRAFLDQNLGSIRLSVDEVMQLYDLTNGWPASLQLACIMLRNQADGRRQLQQDVGWRSSDLYTYLSEEVTGALPPGVAEFLEQVSICRRFSAPLARAVTGRADAAAIIDQIEQENLLLIRVESADPHPWFRFHPLFAEFLATRLARRDPAEIDALHRRASRWFDENGLIKEAIRHATRGHDLDAAVRIVEHSMPSVWRLSYLQPLLHLVSSLPLSAIASRPKLVYLGSLTLALTGTTERAIEWAAQLPGGDLDRKTAFRMALLQAIIANLRDDAHAALMLTDDLSVDEGPSRFESYTLLGYRAAALAAHGRFAEAYRLFDDHPVQAGDLDDGMALLALGTRPMILQMQGRVVEALAMVRDFYDRHAARQGRNSVGADLSAVGVADALYELNRIEEAREMLAYRQHGLKRAMPQIMINAALVEVRLEHVQVAADSALAMIEERIARFRAMGLDRAVAHMLLCRIQLLIGKGDRPSALETLKPLLGLADQYAAAEGFLAEIPILAAMGRARLALAQRDHAGGVAAVEGARPLVERLGRERWLVLLDLLRAQLEADHGGLAAGSEHFTRALVRGAALGLVRTFVDEGGGIRQLLVANMGSAALSAEARDHAQSLRGHFAEVDRPSDRIGRDESEEQPVLTPREVEILRLVAAGMFNKQIAITIGITLETVKWNLKNIFLKLGVSSRYDAMIRARRLGLID